MSQTFNRAEYGRRSTAARPRPSATVLYSVLGAGERDGQVSGRPLPLEFPAVPRGPRRRAVGFK